MRDILRIKEFAQRIYTAQDYWLLPLAKAAVAFLCLIGLNQEVGVYPLVQNPVIELALAVLCSFLPWTTISVLTAVIMLVNLSKASMGLFVMGCVVCLFILLTQSAFRAGNGFLIALVPLLFYFHIPYVIPLIAGLTLGVLTAIPIACGTLMYFFIEYAGKHMDFAVKTKDMTEMVTAYTDLFTDFFLDKYMLAVAAAFVICFILVFIVRCMPFDYSFEVALVVGSVGLMAALVIGSDAVKGNFDLKSGALDIILSIVLAYVFVFMTHGADYQGTQRLRFEDEEYYYYVRAVPKIRAAETDEDE